MKKNTVIFAALITALVVLTSCGGPRMISLEPEANEMWSGKTHASIIEAYGAPNKEMSDGMGGKIIVYENTTTTVTTTADNPFPTSVVDGYYDGLYGFYYHVSDPFGQARVRTETETKTDYANFYIDGKGICYKVETNLKRPETKREKERREAKTK